MVSAVVVIAQDERCIDAWVHLGNIALDARGPRAAVKLYERAVGVGEQSLPREFGGVLPWGLVDNRPMTCSISSSNSLGS